MGGGGSQSKTTKKGYTIGGNNDPTMQPFSRDELPQLQGTPKQIAWAQDIRERWIKDEFEKVQRMYKENVDVLEKRKKTNPEKYQKEIDFGEERASGRRNYIKAARIVLGSTTSSKQIIESRNYINDIVQDVADAIYAKKSKKQIREVISYWMET